jgi:hypothetical protein
MLLFALFFAPLFLLFWVSFPRHKPPHLFSAAAALLTGAVSASVRYLLIDGPRFHDFGLPFYGVVLGFEILPPIALPTVVFVLLRQMRVLSARSEADNSGGWTAWLLTALVPYNVIFALSSPDAGTVKALVLLPLLWAGQIVAVHFFVARIAGTGNVLLRVLLTAAAFAVPFLGAAVYGAWFAKDLLWFLGLLLPLAVVCVLAFLPGRGRSE